MCHRGITRQSILMSSPPSVSCLFLLPFDFSFILLSTVAQLMRERRPHFSLGGSEGARGAQCSGEDIAQEINKPMLSKEACEVSRSPCSIQLFLCCVVSVGCVSLLCVWVRVCVLCVSVRKRARMQRCSKALQRVNILPFLHFLLGGAVSRFYFL